MTNTSPPTFLFDPSGAQIQETELEQGYKDKTLDTIKKLVTGNGINPEAITTEKLKGSTLRFGAYTLISLQTTQSNNTKPGRYETAEKIESEEAIKAAMEKTYRALATTPNLEQELHEAILTHENRGFSNTAKIPLPKLKKEFVIIKPCPMCHAKGKVPCLPCNGKGRIICPRCKGTGRTPCTHCNGTKMVPVPSNANQKMACPMCHGQGYKSCILCNQTGYVTCKTCAGRGETTCPTCQGAAWNSHIFTQEIHAHTTFVYPQNKLPPLITQTIEKMVEKHSKKMTEDTAIQVLTEPTLLTRWKQEQAENPDSPFAQTLRQGDICFPILYDITLPYGELTFQINDKSYQTFLFGQKARSIQTPFFLDDLLEEGIKALENAANLQGNVHENLKAAGKFRSLKEAIILSTSNNRAKAERKLKARNPIGLSKNTIKDIINNANRALKNITKKPRIIGLSIISALYAVLFGTYFCTPLRNIINAHIPNTTLHTLCDIIIYATITYAGIIGIQSIAQSSLKKTMATLIPSGKVKFAPPKLGKILYWNLAISGIIFITAIEIARHISEEIPPTWYSALLGL